MKAIVDVHCTGIANIRILCTMDIISTDTGYIMWPAPVHTCMQCSNDYFAKTIFVT